MPITEQQYQQHSSQLQQEDQQQQQQCQQQQPQPNNNPTTQKQQQNNHQQQNNQHDQQSSTTDHHALQTLKQQITLTNHQLLQLTYNDQKFYQKLKQLNHYGCIYIKRMQFPQALVYLSEAEKVLEYAASCGKTIERKLIISTLNNQASLYQKAWELEKAESYLQAIIYNISSFFQTNNSNNNNNNNSSQYQPQPQSIKSLTRLQQFTNNILDNKSVQFQDYSIALWRKKSLAIFYLQYCAINSQNKNNQRAFKSAQKALSLIKQLCIDLYKYEKYISEHNNQQQQSEQDQQYEQQKSPLNKNNKTNTLYQLGNFPQIQTSNSQFQQFYKTAVKHIAMYIKRIQQSASLQMITRQEEKQMQVYKQHFENYSIGTIMQINPSQLDQQIDRLDLKLQLSLIQKHFKAIYLSVGHFILGTQARFIASQKYTLDETQRRQSPQFKSSQIYHLCSIIILTKYLKCESGYFDHIVNSFRNHYKLDIMEDARECLQREEQLEQGDNECKQDDGLIELFYRQPKINKIINKQQKKPYNNNNQCLVQQVQQIQNLQSQIKTVNEIQQQIGYDDTNQGPMLNNYKTEQQQQRQYEGNNSDEIYSKKEKYSSGVKSTKVSKNSNGGRQEKKQVNNDGYHSNKYQQQQQQKQKVMKQDHGHGHNTVGTKKPHTKKPSNTVAVTTTTKRQSGTTINKLTTSHHHQHKQKTIHMVTSRQKQSKPTITINNNKPTQLNSNTKTSRSKQKTDYQFLTSNKKIKVINQNNNNNINNNNINSNSRQRVSRQYMVNKQKQVQTKRQTIYSSKRQSDYIINNNTKISRSKSKTTLRKLPTTTADGDKKYIRRKDSYGDLRKTKRVEEQYGVYKQQQQQQQPIVINSNNSRHLDAYGYNNTKGEINTSRNNLHSNNNGHNNNMKKSKNRIKQSQQKVVKLTSPQLKLRKLKSPKNIKK